LPETREAPASASQMRATASVRHPREIICQVADSRRQFRRSPPPGRGDHDGREQQGGQDSNASAPRHGIRLRIEPATAATAP
ncbi:MAG: hypothetical protein M3O34_11290, partial [Chloroflexota bacterium]|nr:hypothetical protein [Chloroflexota bacterium]